MKKIFAIFALLMLVGCAGQPIYVNGTNGNGSLSVSGQGVMSRPVYDSQTGQQVGRTSGVTTGGVLGGVAGAVVGAHGPCESLKGKHGNRYAACLALFAGGGYYLGQSAQDSNNQRSSPPVYYAPGQSGVNQFMSNFQSPQLPQATAPQAQSPVIKCPKAGEMPYWAKIDGKDAIICK